MKNCREVRQEDAALTDVVSGLTSDRVHDEICYFQCRLTRTFRHKVAFDRYRLPVLFEAEALHRVLNQRVRALAGFEDDVQLFEWRGSRYIYDPILQDLRNRRHWPVILHQLGVDRDYRA